MIEAKKKTIKRLQQQIGDLEDDIESLYVELTIRDLERTQPSDTELNKLFGSDYCPHMIRKGDMCHLCPQDTAQ